MELWIRSQNKELLVLAKGFEFQKLYDGRFQIFAVWQNNYQMVGIYKSKKRALEVLDEIEKILMPEIKVVHNKVERRDLDGFRAEYIMQPMIEDVQVLEASSYVYKMPKE